MNMGVFPSGQWGQTVNLLLSASVVRIHPRPPRERLCRNTQTFFFYSFLKFHPQGWIRTASARRIVRRGKKPLRGFFRCTARDIHPRPPKNLNVRKYAEVFVLLQSQTHRAGGFEQHRPAEQSGVEKSPCGAFLDARLAISTRAHQKGRRTLKNNPRADQNPCLRTKARTQQQLHTGCGLSLCKRFGKGKGGKREFQFYAAFAGAKTNAFFRRACIERTMQLRVKLMIK